MCRRAPRSTGSRVHRCRRTPAPAERPGATAPRPAAAPRRRRAGWPASACAAAISSAVTASGWWQAARWPPAYSTSGGSDGAAELGRARAARVEAAAGRRRDRVRRLALDLRPRAAAVLARVGDRDRAEQRRGVGVDRLLVELLRRRELDDLAEVHHRDPVGDMAHDGEVVGDEDEGQRAARPAARRAG